MAGISRSATIVVAYLMKEHKYEVEQAIALCKQRRSIIRYLLPKLVLVLNAPRIVLTRDLSDNY